MERFRSTPATDILPVAKLTTRKLTTIVRIGSDHIRITWLGNRGTYPRDYQPTRSSDFANQQWLSLVSRLPWDCQAAPTGIPKTLCSPRKPVPYHKCTAALRAYVRAARKLGERPRASPSDQSKLLRASCRDRARVSYGSRLDHRHLGRLENLRRSRAATAALVACLTRS